MKRIGFSGKILVLLKLCAAGLIIGVLGGLISAIFYHLLSFVTGLRETAPWVILILPLGGIVIVMLYRVFGIKEDCGTNTVIESLENNGKLGFAVAPLIFVSTAITHLLGGSAGKEGAAIQLGGVAASRLSDFWHVKNEERTVFIMCGMGAMFAGMFSTPLTAAFFVMEFKSNKKTLALAPLPCLISAIAAKSVSSFLGVAEENFALKSDISFSFGLIGKILVLSIGIYLLGVAVCFIFSKMKKWAKMLISNSFYRIVLGAVLIILLSICVGDMRYNGSGIDMAIAAAEGRVQWFDFILKIVFTAITLAAGFKGGEIVPTFCIGATFGCVLGGLLGLDFGLAAALGLTGLFCCATSSPVSAVFLGIELFGFSVLPYLIIVCIFLWLLPKKGGLFVNRFFESPLLHIIKKAK